MKRFRRLVVLTLLLAFLLGLTAVYAEGGSSSPAGEEAGLDFDWDQYSYEQLQVIKEEFDRVFAEKQREYAIENGNRKIVLSESESKIYVGKSLKIDASIERVTEDAPASTALTWKSSDEKVAKVSAAGEVKGIAAGSAVITCRASDDDNIFCELSVEVIEPVKSIALDSDKQTLVVSDQGSEGSQVRLSYSVLPENAFCKDVVWSSSDVQIAKVDQNGLVTAVAPGKATITVTSEDEYSKSTKPVIKTCLITVNKAASSISLSNSSAVLDKKEKIVLKAEVLPGDATDKKVVWESSDPSVVTVSATGQVAAVGCGEAIIRCFAADGGGAKSECKVSVIQKVTGVKITTPNLTINRNSSDSVKVSITPEDATNKKLKWTSSDEKVATVDENGKVTAVSGGKATITCETTDGSNKSATATVFIPSFKSSKTEYRVTDKAGSTITIEYYGKRSDLSVTSSGKAFFDYTTQLSGNQLSIKISPIKAGAGTLTFKDKSDSKNTTAIKVTIDHSAVYDSTSYPKGDYSSIMRYPSAYKGDNISIYGRVLQVQNSWGGYTLRVATRGRWDDVFYVTGSSDLSIIEYDYITIYGKCTGTKTYTTILGGSITIPSMEIEKVFYGRH